MKQFEEKPENVNEIIQEWKKLNVGEVRFVFSCGGDSMNETSFEISDVNGKTIDENLCGNLTSYFEDEVYRRVEFYVNSDGHYIGEFGNVSITLNDEDDFDYYKSSSSEWSESYTEEVKIPISDEEKKFIQTYISDFSGENDSLDYNYKTDFVLTNEMEDLLSNLETRITETCNDYEFEEPIGDQQDEIRYESNGEVTIDNNELSVWVTRWFYETREE